MAEIEELEITIEEQKDKIINDTLVRVILFKTTLDLNWQKK